MNLMDVVAKALIVLIMTVYLLLLLFLVPYASLFSMLKSMPLLKLGAYMSKANVLLGDVVHAIVLLLPHCYLISKRLLLMRHGRPTGMQLRLLFNRKSLSANRIFQ